MGRGDARERRSFRHAWRKRSLADFAETMGSGM
nr:MAG TPA: hypothetical protein [Caudoviricetes sp.]